MPITDLTEAIVLHMLILAFQTAYLKAHYPCLFLCICFISMKLRIRAKIYKYSNELRTAGLKLLPPDINESDEGFTPLENAVRFGLTAIKGIGSASVQAIIEARKKGEFRSIVDFAERLEQGAVNRKALESLIMAGAFDSLKPEEINLNQWRARLLAGIEAIISHGQKVSSDQFKRSKCAFWGQ